MPISRRRQVVTRSVTFAVPSTRLLGVIGPEERKPAITGPVAAGMLLIRRLWREHGARSERRRLPHRRPGRCYSVNWAARASTGSATRSSDSRPPDVVSLSVGGQPSSLTE
jgi:hypothetical protein